MAIEIVGSTAPTVQQGDTLRLRARAVDASGDSVPDATIIWALLDVDSGQVGFTLDTLTGVVTAFSPGSGRVQARVGNLRSGIVTVTVTDTTSATGSVAVSLPPRADWLPGAAVRRRIVRQPSDRVNQSGTPWGLEIGRELS